MNRRWMRYRATFVLLAACAALAAILWYGPRSQTGMSRAEPAPAASAPEPPHGDDHAGVEQTHSVGDYRAAAERPLFIPERRPPPVAAQSSRVKEPELPEYRLQGVIVAAGEHSAILKNTETSKVVRVTAGAQLGDWRVKSLESDHIVLSFRDTERDIRLWTFASQSGVRSDTRPAARAQQRRADLRAENRRSASPESR